MKLSIITVNRNNAEGLAKTMASVFNQSISDFEYIIVDGASTDDSVKVAKDAISSQNLLPEGRIHFSSEPDNGIYNAMNKGVSMASGEYLMFMNSGDCLKNDSIIETIYKLNSNADIIIGRVSVLLDDGKTWTSPQLFESDLGLYGLCLKGICHQATLTKRNLLISMPFDESYHICADWHFFVKQIIFNNCVVELTPLVICDYDGTGVSSSNPKSLDNERKRCMHELFPERIIKEYNTVIDHYYEVIRLKWLLDHRCFYKLYRAITSFGIRLFSK